MGRRFSSSGIPAPSRRPLKIFAIDPMQGRTYGNRARIEVVNEPLQPGPVGERLAVVDYDGDGEHFYEAVDLDQPELLMQGGLDPSESDPRFHQQMVYAVASRTIENFDRALGRRIKLGTRKHPKLRLFPHAFCGANAYYSRDMNAVLFGYFRADRTNPGENLPGQTVFTCLSHDVIAHEITHKMIDRLRPLFLEPSNEDVLAFHEGFADLVALFQHFSIPEALRDQIAQSRSNIKTPLPLVQLARQFGYATGSGTSLRSALDQADSQLYQTETEPHSRGSILVSAVFDGFYKAYSSRTSALIRLATQGTGILPEGDLHPELVTRIAAEASKTAQRVLDMCIRAFDYLPPVDITFGDFLRALITADYELIPEDELNLRSAMIEAFRLRGIYPSGVVSLAEESLLWSSGKDLPALPDDVMDGLQELFFSAVLDFEKGGINETSPMQAQSEISRSSYKARFDPGSLQESAVQDEEGIEEVVEVGEQMGHMLNSYAVGNAEKLGLSNLFPIQVRGFHPVFRVAPNGRLVIELIAQFAQQDKTNLDAHGGIPVRAGATLIIGVDGRVRYLIDKPMPGAPLSAERQRLATDRLKRQETYIARCDAADPSLSYLTVQERNVRMLRLSSLARLHAE